MERPAPSASLSDLFAGIPAPTEPELFGGPELIAGSDYLLHDQQFLQEQEALQLLNQTNSFSLSPSSSSFPSSPSARSDATRKNATKATKKRQRVAEDVSGDDSNRKMTPVSLTRERLLSMTSKEYEAYMKDVTRRRDNLTPDEIKDLRWMRRLVKNRESAQVSRDRKKNRLDELSTLWKELKTEQKGLADQLTASEIANKALKEELNNLIGIVRQSPALATLWNNMHLLRKRTTAKLPVDASLFNNPAAAAMCLLLAMHTHNQTLSARAAEPADVEMHPAVRTKCMESMAADELRSEMQFVAEQQMMPSGEQPVLLMLLPQSAAASVLRNQAVAQQALVLDLAGAQLVPAVPVQS